jgi:hypothetical protein
VIQPDVNGLILNSGLSLFGIGRQQSTYGATAPTDDIAWGFGSQLTLGGSSNQKGGVAVPVGFFLRSDGHMSGAEFAGVGDIAFDLQLT